jgi:hypothetical protein
MPSLLPTRWTTPETRSARVDASLFDDEDAALGFESACPALQLEGWHAVAAGAQPQETARN